MIVIFFFICLLPAAWLQDQQDQCPGSSCNPRLGDLMVGRAAQISASSTCGLDGPENYCILGYLEEEQKCFTCDSRLPYNLYSNPNSHRIENIITTFDPERKMKWWQSQNGVHQVSIQLNLEAMFQFSHLVLTFKSFRPAAMLVERSKDFGRTWKVLRYFAEDCALHFPSVSDEAADSVDDVVCDSRYSGSEPSSDGEVVLKALDPIFEIENPYAPEIQELITITNIRVNFTRLFTLGDTLLSRKRRNPLDKYYYALYNMVVRGSCFCHGHASQCTSLDGGRGDVFNQPGMVHGQCICHHNTAGENCERCQDFHHDSPWRPGGQHDVCRRCNCHGHSESCHFDPARFQATGGRSGGICIDCRNDRVGPQCEQCRPFLYQDPQRAPEDPNACIPCDCDPAGSQGGGLCDPLSGQCVCKENVEGIRCDRCKQGFYNLRQEDPSGCQVCRCHGLGSVGSCDPLTGSCECDRLASGALCEHCLAGFWGLGDSGFRCSPCDCDVGGAHGTTCSPHKGQCECLPNMVGRRCTAPASGYFLPPLDYFLYEAELAAPLGGGSSSFNPVSSPASASYRVKPDVLPECEQHLRKQGYEFKLSHGRVVVVRRTRRARHRRQAQQSSIPLEPGHNLQLIPRQRTPNQPITWTGLGLVRVLEGAGLRFTVDNLPSSMDYQLVIRYEPESPTDWLASITIITLSPGNGGCNDATGSKTLILPGNSRGSVLDTALCLNAGGRYFVDVIFHKQPGSDESSHIMIDSMGLIPKIESINDFCSQNNLDSFRQFRCVGLVVQLGSQLPEVCEGLIGSMSARIHNGAVACRCNVVGSHGPTCSKLGGFCECKPNVIGRCCDTCAPQTYGFGTDGCKPCECDPRGSESELCDQVRGQCACRPEVTGRRCGHCQTGFWGFPSCQPCECNGLSEVCDKQSGECLHCREHATGPQCDRCVEGYYGNPASRQPCQPCLCPDVHSSGRFFATSCHQNPESLSATCNCREGHTGPRCDRCSPGYYGDLTVPGVRCHKCNCNNNIDLNDREACDVLTGTCLRCLHNTMGSGCQNCKRGYYGNALEQDCKECSCDRRGTQVTLCPVGSPCYCDWRTGHCPCRKGVMGDLCNECEDGYWNLDAGCQPCKCDPANSLSNVCNKVSGQCPCRDEFGGRQCDECAENHFGNPDLQCISCDCNLEGTLRPSCDPETGECRCRVGVTGIFCDECAPGYENIFPACKECHPCNALWVENVTDVQRAAQKMRTLLPRPGDELRPGGGLPQQKMLEMHSKLEGLANLTKHSPLKVEKMEKLFHKIRKLKDSIDPNEILINPSSLLNTDINNILQEFKNLLNNLKRSLMKQPNAGDLQELLDELQKLQKGIESDEKRVKEANKALEDSMKTRQEAKHKLNNCSDQEPLDKMVKDLSLLNLNRKICGEPGLEDCSGCGGALCLLPSGNRKCGGQKCDGVVPLSVNASQTAERNKDILHKLPIRLQEYNNKLNEAHQVAHNTKTLAKDLKDRINNTIDTFKREKQKTKELIQRAKDYLLDDLVAPEDIEKMSRAVLAIQLPKSTEEIRNMIKSLNKLLSNGTDFQVDQKKLEEYTKKAHALKKKAQDLKERIKHLDVSDINRNIYEAEKSQNKANNDLDTASRDTDMIKNQIREITDKLDKVEPKLRSRRPEELLDGINALKNKSEQNKEQARKALEAAESARDNAADAQTELDNVRKQYEDLMQKNQNLTGQDEGKERLKNIVDEAKKLQREVENKLRLIQDVEQKIQQLITRKNEKAADVAKLLNEVDNLRRDLSKRVDDYSSC